MKTTWQAEQIEKLEVGQSIKEGFVSVTRRPNTKTGRPVYLVAAYRPSPLLQAGEHCWSPKAAAKLANRFAGWLK